MKNIFVIDASLALFCVTSGIYIEQQKLVIFRVV